ncbi:NAD-dependent succinate-semialdehyde dehydrogenase [Gammaproteobacteria bacterium]|nr:NAD-dependent succinate-semialdehyde dehydrogenase [Gammaproteobacteria bacterium]
MAQAEQLNTNPLAHYPELQLFIAGEWVSKGDRKSEDVLNPATGEVLGELPHATEADLDRALAAAEEGFKVWRDKLPEERSAVLRKAAALMREREEQITTAASLESGKPIMQSRMELKMSTEVLEWYAEEGRRAYGRVLTQRQPGSRMYVVKEPVGPVAAFAPWNFPQGNPARKMGASLAAGCSCVFKPAEETPATGLLMAKCLQDAGLPDGVLSVVYGVPHVISTYLLSSPIIRKMSFTGSVPVGKALMKLAADNMIRTTMELGGHAPVLVFEDADLESTLDMAVAAKFRNAGQVCVSPTRFYVHESLHARFVEGFTARVNKIVVGNGLDENTQMGPLIHARRRDAISDLVDDAVKNGATLNTGGEAIEGPGNFYKPTVLSDIPLSARIMNEEPFGPVALINSFNDFDAVMKEANRLPFGLAAFAFTENTRRVNQLGEQLEAGMIGINSFGISVPESPFGGIKESGHGSEEGIEGLEACLVTKFITEV